MGESIAAKVKDGVLKYPKLAKHLRAEPSLEMFRVAEVAVARRPTAYKSWIARDPAYVLPDAEGYDELLRLQRQIAVSAIRELRDSPIIKEIPDAVLSAMAPAQTIHLLTVLTDDDEDNRVHDRILAERVAHVLRILGLTRIDVETMGEPLALTLARTFPEIYCRICWPVARTARFVAEVIRGDVSRMTWMGQDTWSADVDVAMEVARFAMCQDPFKAYAVLPPNVRYSADNMQFCVRLAIQALQADMGAYRHMPHALKVLAWTERELPWVDYETRPGLVDFRRYLVEYGMPFSEAAARAAVDYMQFYYSYVPMAVIEAIDARCGHTFSRQVILRSPHLAINTPDNSPIFDDRRMCARVLVRGDAVAYIRFPAGARADAVHCVSKLNLTRMVMCGTFAAILQAAFLGPGVSNVSFTILRDRLLAPYGDTFVMYQEMMYAQPLILRMLNEPLFRSLLHIYSTTFRMLALALDHELAMYICKFVFGPEHLERLKAAMEVPAGDVEALRVTKGLVAGEEEEGPGSLIASVDEFLSPLTERPAGLVSRLFGDRPGDQQPPAEANAGPRLVGGRIDGPAPPPPPAAGKRRAAAEPDGGAWDRGTRLRTPSGSAKPPRRARGPRRVPSPGENYLRRVKSGEIWLFPRVKVRYHPQWVVARHIADHGTQPRLCHSEAKCHRCARCRAEEEYAWVRPDGPPVRSRKQRAFWYADAGCVMIDGN